jgi:hypothetical protein
MIRGSLAGSPAPVLDVLVPVLDINADPRGVRPRVRSPRHVQVVQLYVRPEADVEALELAGQRLPGRPTAPLGP